MNENGIMGSINSIETFGAVDGPGVRYIVFLQGCRMRCQYCHNPETWADTAEGSYKETPAVTFQKAWRYHNYWKNGGGITVSGGEALLQMDYVTELFRLAKEKGVHTTLDTSGQPFSMDAEVLDKFNALMEVTDLFLLDIKQIDPDKHKKLTGWDNSNILELARYLAQNHKHFWIRHVLVPGITTGEEDQKKLRAFIDELREMDAECVERVEVLPYHRLGVAKYDKLSIPYSLREVQPPTREEIEQAENILVHG
jgi:pyruvate formate lyase activating enzyme